MPRPLSATVDIDAPRERVWEIVSDLRRMGERSPQCRASFARGELRRGSHLVNINRAGRLWWPTTSKVVDWHPGQRVAFRILENRAVWSFTVEDLDGDPSRTRLTERREVPRGTSPISKGLIGAFLGGNDDFEAELLRGMETTLGAVKEEAER